MNLVAIADLHGSLERARQILAAEPAADLFLLLGDITHFGSREDVAAILNPFLRAGRRILGVPGNCDPPEVEEWLAANRLSLHGRTLTVDGITFLGMGKSLPCPGGTPNETTEAAFADGLNPDRFSVPGPHVLVTHHPPFDTAVDRAGFDHHVGSRSVRRFIELVQPCLALSGHIHESRAIGALGPTCLVNPGPARSGHYATITLKDGHALAELNTLT